jgi:hypothetical protein
MTIIGFFFSLLLNATVATSDTYTQGSGTNTGSTEYVIIEDVVGRGN